MQTINFVDQGFLHVSHRDGGNFGKHSANNPFHYTEWLWVQVNSKMNQQGAWHVAAKGVQLQDKMRYILITFMIFLVSLASCSASDPYLQKKAKDVYSQKTWEYPLPPHEFTSDGCSYWPDDEWIDCCVEHDAIYWMGGTREERKQADMTLLKCVGQTRHPIIGKMMYYGVRLGGVCWLPTPFRWGFGWRYPQCGPPQKKY